jgi:hypothetical protein
MIRTSKVKIAPPEGASTNDCEVAERETERAEVITRCGQGMNESASRRSSFRVDVRLHTGRAQRVDGEASVQFHGGEQDQAKRLRACEAVAVAVARAGRPCGKLLKPQRQRPLGQKHQEARP